MEALTFPQAMLTTCSTVQHSKESNTSFGNNVELAPCRPDHALMGCQLSFWHLAI